MRPRARADRTVIGRAGAAALLAAVVAVGVVAIMVVTHSSAGSSADRCTDTSSLSSPTSASSTSSIAAGAPSCGTWWGLAPDVANAQLPAAVSAQEAADGRRLDIVHTYHRWYDNFPSAAERSLADDGHLLLLNWEPTDTAGKPMAWAAIARGDHDDEIDALAAKLKTMPTVLLSFSHEPEHDYGSHGTAGDFAAAFRRVVDRLRADGASNVRFVWDVEGLTDPVWLARYASLWPGANYVDWVAWDPYNWADCRTPTRSWKSFSQTVTPFYDWLAGHGYGDKPFMLAEYGTVEKTGDPNGKASWFGAIPAALTSLPKLRALVYFDFPAPPANCNWQITTSAVATNAFHELATSAPFRPAVTLNPTKPVT
jgi:hypothetical protein